MWLLHIKYGLAIVAWFFVFIAGWSLVVLMNSEVDKEEFKNDVGFFKTLSLIKENIYVNH